MGLTKQRLLVLIVEGKVTSNVSAPNQHNKVTAIRLEQIIKTINLKTKLLIRVKIATTSTTTKTDRIITKTMLQDKQLHQTRIKLKLHIIQPEQSFLFLHQIAQQKTKIRHWLSRMMKGLIGRVCNLELKKLLLVTWLVLHNK